MGNLLSQKQGHEPPVEFKKESDEMREVLEVFEELDAILGIEGATGGSKLKCALDLIHRLPPQQIDKHLENLIELAPNLCEDVLSSVEQPLKVAKDEESGRDYLLCDYNREGDSYRSPWSNTYDPPLEEGTTPSERVRLLEIEANQAIDQYREMYYRGGVSSVYLWDRDNSFSGAILIKNDVNDDNKKKGCWNTIHVVELNDTEDEMTQYKLASTVMCWLETYQSAAGVMTTGCSLSRQMEKTVSVSEDIEHIINIGQMVEEMENKLLFALDDVYFSRTKDAISCMRRIQTKEEEEAEVARRSKLARVSMAPAHLQHALQNDLNKAILRRSRGDDLL